MVSLWDQKTNQTNPIIFNDVMHGILKGGKSVQNWGWKPPLSSQTVFSVTLPETNSSHLKMDGWNTTFLSGLTIFRCHVSFRECRSLRFPVHRVVPKHTPQPTNRSPAKPRVLDQIRLAHLIQGQLGYTAQTSGEYLDVPLEVRINGLG